jgi:hypothetical protein
MKVPTIRDRTDVMLIGETMPVAVLLLAVPKLAVAVLHE